jgi:ATP-dependent Lon protease
LRFSLPTNITGRDERAIHKALSGLIKLLYPDGQPDEVQLRECRDLACELRQRVRDQLHILAPGEFDDYGLGYCIPAGSQVYEPHRPKKPTPFHVDLPDEPRVGEVNGLAVVGGVGCLLQIDVKVLEGSGRLIKTGNIQRIMGESLTAAYDYVRGNTERLGITRDFNKDYDIHVHIRRIADPKEGPSAGVTLLVGLVSALTERPVRPRIALTGEIMINGLVLGVGGIQEKLRAAAAGITDALVPVENAAHVDALAVQVREALRIATIDRVDQALEACLI